MAATSMAGTMSPELLKVMERAKDPNFVFLSLAHLIDEVALTRAFHRIRKDAAVEWMASPRKRTGRNWRAASETSTRGCGRCDGGTNQSVGYISRRRRGRAGPSGSRRRGQNRAGGSARDPRGCDEPLFRDFSYGFRKGRSAHDALRALYQVLYGGGGCGFWSLT